MALYSSHLLQYSELKLGERIRDARQQQGLTLRQLASRLGTSSARLSQIENERVRVHLQDVQEVAEALDIPLDALIPTDVTLPYQITRDTDMRTRPPKPTRLSYPDGSDGQSSPHQYWSLANLFLGRHLEPVLGRIMPLDERELCFCYHDEEEFAFALRGRLEFRIKTPDGEHCEELMRGDSVYFRSDLPHCFRSLEAEPAETIHVFCSPSVSTAGGLDWAHSRAIVYTGDGGSNLQRRVGQKLMLLARGTRVVARPGRAVGRSERPPGARDRTRREGDTAGGGAESRARVREAAAGVDRPDGRPAALLLRSAVEGHFEQSEPAAPHARRAAACAGLEDLSTAVGRFPGEGDVSVFPQDAQRRSWTR